MNVQQMTARIQQIWAEADRAGRDATFAERAEVEQLLKRIEGEKSRSAAAAALNGNDWYERGQAGAFGQGPGDVFVRSSGFKSIADSGSRPTKWSTGMIEVGEMTGGLLKGTLLEGTGAPGSGSGGGLVAAPQVIPGVVEKLFQPLTLEALFSSAQATTSTVRYAQEGTAISGAAGVAEGGDKPQSTLGLSTQDEQVKKVATSLVIGDELLDDSAAVGQFVNNRLALFVRIESERQLLRGTAGGNEVQGLLTGRGVPVYAGGTAAGNKAVQIFRAMNGTRGSAYVEPAWTVMNPSDWESIRLLTDSTGQFFGGGPFQAPYGGGVNAPASGQALGAADYLWNKPVYVTSALGAGTALIGNPLAAQVWNRGGLSVEMTNSHSDYFLKDLTAVRAERRLALAVYRPSAFCEVRLA